MAREVKLNEPKEYVLQELVKVRISLVKINMLLDDGHSVIADLVLDEPSMMLKRVTLWEGESYEKIGQWTDEDVDKRIVELINQ